MNVLKMISLFLALLLIGTNTTFAQTRVTNITEEQKEEIKKNIEEYAVALSLSGDQRNIFEEITKKYAKQMKALKDSGGSRMSKFRKMKSIRKNKDAEMKSLLSQGQYEIYLEKQEEMRKKMKERQ